MNGERITDVRVGAYLAADVMRCAGKKGFIYLNKFEKVDQKGYSFNWCAALFTSLWFAYRKMWKAAAAVMGVNVVYSVLLSAAEAKFLTAGNATAFMGTAVALFIVEIVVFGLFGDKIYWRHVSKILDDHGCRGRKAVENSALNEKLEKAGGTSIVGVVILWLVSVVLDGGITWLIMMIL